MQYPEIITRLPQADLPFPSTSVRSCVLQSENGQMIFFQILEDLDLPAHSHKGQWGMVIDGRMELTIAGKTNVHERGGSYYIPSGVVHSAKIAAGTLVMDFFEEPNRYRLK